MTSISTGVFAQAARSPCINVREKAHPTQLLKAKFGNLSFEDEICGYLSSPVHNRLSAIRYLVAHAEAVDQLLDKVDQEEPAARHYLGERLDASVETREALSDLKFG